MERQDYGTVYDMFAGSVQSVYPLTSFGTSAAEVDQIEGKVSACVPDTSAGPSSGSNTASFPVKMTRTKQGIIQGIIHLTNTDGTWQVADADASLWGVSLDALSAAQQFCGYLQSQDYSSATDVFSSDAQSSLSGSNFAQYAQLDDTYAGKITSCTITAIGQGSNDTQDQFTLAIARGQGTNTTGQLLLNHSSGPWQVASFDPSILGEDYRPVVLAEQFCSDVSTVQGSGNNASAAYALLDPAVGTKSDFMNYWGSAAFIYECREPDMSTYQESGGSATVEVKLGISNGYTTTNFTLTLDFAIESGKWVISGWQTA